MNKSIHKIAIVIPNFNGEMFLHKAIDSLLAQSMQATIIVVENGSTDRSVQIIKKYNKKIIPIFNKTNLGFAGGVNCGIKYAIKHRYDAVALFNNDAVAKNTWLEQLVNSMQSDPQTGITTGQIQLLNNTMDSTGEIYTSWGLPYPRGRGESTTKEAYKQPGYTFGASGGASLYRTAMFQDIGIFDEDFFAYYEDTDISFRAQLYGWKVYYNPMAVVYHEQGATSKRIPGFTVFQTFKNLPLLLHKNVPRNIFWGIACRFYLAYTIILLKAVVVGNGWAALQGVLKAVTLSQSTHRKRLQIQAQKKVSSSYISEIILHDLPPNQTGLRKLRRLFTGHS